MSAYNGDTVAIGAHKNDGTATDAGHVRVYRYNGTDWVQLGSDLDGEMAATYGTAFGYSVSLSGDGNRLAVSDPDNDGNGTDAGHVRLFQWNGTAWTQLGGDLDGPVTGGFFGWSVALSKSGDTIVAGIPCADSNGANAGRVKAYTYAPTFNSIFLCCSC